MEPWKWQQLLWTVGFLGITYIPLQCVAIWKCRGVMRVAAGLPLLVMVPMNIGACRPMAYDNGSLYGMFFVCPYLLPLRRGFLALCRRGGNARISEREST